MLDLTNIDVLELLRALGVPYVWGGGALADGPETWPEGARVQVPGGYVRGWDCSGFAQAALLALGQVRPDAWPDIRAHDLANACDPVHPGEEQIGDLAFYGGEDARGKSVISHVMVVLAAGLVIGATGGTSRTMGMDARACVAACPLRYRRDLVVVGRIKEEYRA